MAIFNTCSKTNLHISSNSYPNLSAICETKPSTHPLLLLVHYETRVFICLSFLGMSVAIFYCQTYPISCLISLSILLFSKSSPNLNCSCN